MNFEEKKVNEDCNKIADHYGQAVEMHKSIKEMAELIQVLSRGYTSKDEHNIKQTLIIAELIEEIADVLICLHHLQHVFAIEDSVNEKIKDKIERQLKRMQQEEKDDD